MAEDNEPASGGADGTHTHGEDHPWTIQIPDHPKRTESAVYVRSRKKMNEIARTIDGFEYGPAPYHDHHGGGLWLKDDAGWFLVRNMIGIEWSAQFCADPAKVDRMRVNARRLYARFPEAVAELGIRKLLDEPITDAEGVARFTDSLLNASVPLPVALHTGVLPKASTGGVHHYPGPIAEIDLIRRDDFQLWVDTPEGAVAAVVPVSPRGSGDGRTRLLFVAEPPQADVPTPVEDVLGGGGAGPGGPFGGQNLAEEDGEVILSADHPLSLQAFARQT